MDVNLILKNIGLHNSEISVYIFLLENGPSSLQNVSRETKISRTNCYTVLSGLKEKKLILEHTEPGSKIYSALDPESLVAFVENKRRSVESLLGELHRRQLKSSHKPKFESVTGINGLRSLLLSTFTSTEVLSSGLTELLKSNGVLLFNWYQQELSARHILNFDTPSDDHRNATLVFDHSVSFVNIDTEIYVSTLTSPSIAGQMYNLLRNKN